MMQDLDYQPIPDISALPGDEAPALQPAQIHTGLDLYNSVLTVHTTPEENLGLEFKRLEPRPNRMKLKRASSADAPQEITLHHAAMESRPEIIHRTIRLLLQCSADPQSKEDR
jgi:hypothetical protein